MHICECIYSKYYNSLDQYMVKFCIHVTTICICIFMSSYLQKLSLMAQLVFQEIPITNIESTMVLLCYIVAM